MTRRALISLVAALFPLPSGDGAAPLRECVLRRDEKGFSVILPGSNGTVQIRFGERLDSALSIARRFLLADIS